MYKVKQQSDPRLHFLLAYNKCDMHNYCTGQSGAHLTLLKPKTNDMKNAFFNREVEVWNVLAPSQKSSTTLANSSLI